MAMNDQLRKIIEELAANAKAGQAQWEKINPSTFKLEQEDSYLTLQRVDASGITGMLGGVVKYQYVLQAVTEESQNNAAEDSRKVLFRLSSADREEYETLLKYLFDAIYNGIESNVAKMLGKFVK